MKICFNTAANSNADSGNETFYLRVINPLGETQAIESQGSGIFTNETTGDEVRYSTVVKTDYSNAVKMYVENGIMQEDFKLVFIKLKYTTKATSLAQLQ